ncbi:MAG: DUF89 family protein [Euryarchaeota archaeon]|nr:DUF89 family protein [Euryarchaeota archaeon]
MKVHYECASCFLRQAKEAMNLATSDESLKMDMTEKITKLVCSRFHKGAVANFIGTEIHRIIKEDSGNNDPYNLEREKCNEVAMKFLPMVKNIIKRENGLESYLKAAIVGNVIDFGALGLNFDVEAKIIQSMNKGFAINHTKQLKNELDKAEDLIYLADNVGEIVFDKLLIDKLKEYDLNISVALKEKPILNDACVGDALQIGLDKLANLTSIGTDSIGIIYEQISEEFRERFENADMVVGKGLGNYEGLSEIETDKPIFCLLNAKCIPVARDIGVGKGDNVVLML